MPLPASPNRKALHDRVVHFQGYERADGLFEIDAHLVDRKSYPLDIPGEERVLPPGEPVHDFWLRVVVTRDLEVREIVTASDAVPHAECHGGGAALASLVGQRIAAGWTERVKRAVGGRQSCTHLMELLVTLGTAAFQTIARVRLARFDEAGKDGRPARIDSCYALAAGSPVVLRLWPAHYRPDATRDVDLD